MKIRNRKTRFKKASRSNQIDRLRIEKERFARDIESSAIRLALAVQHRSDVENDPWPSIEYWQTAIVKIVRWFMNPQGLQFNPWDYIKQEEKNTMKSLCDLRSQWMTRKATPEMLLEILVLDKDSLEIIPTDVSLVDCKAVMRNGTWIQLASSDTTHVGRTLGTLFGIMYLKEESGPSKEVYDLVVRIRDRIRSEKGEDKIDG